MCSSVHYLIICVSFCWAHPLQFWFWIDVTIPISALCAHDIRFQKRNLVYISCSFATCHAILFRMSVLVRCCCFCFFRASKHIHRILFRVHIHYNWAGLRACGSDRVCLYVYKIYPQYGTIFCADHPLLFFNSHSFFNAFSLGKPAIPECGGCCCYSLGRFSNLTMPVRNPSHRIVCCILLYFYTQRHNPHFKSFVIRSTKSTCILFGCRLRYNTNIGQSLSTFAVTGLYAFVSTVPI